MTICPICGDDHDRIAQHWAMSDCGYPEIPEQLRHLLNGIVFAGATTDGGKNTRLRIWTTSEERAHWLQVQLGWLAKEEIRKRPPDTGSNPRHCVSTISHPGLNRYRAWTTGSRGPSDPVSFSPAFARGWFPFAGALNFSRDGDRPAIQIMRQDSAYLDTFESSLETAGFEFGRGDNKIILAANEATRLLRRIGPPVPGTLYKWSLDKQVYDAAIERVRSLDPIIRAGQDETEQMTALLAFLADVLDERLTQEAFRSAIAAPSSEAVANGLGGGDWEDALSVAGVSETLPSIESASTPAPATAKYDAEDYINALQKVADRVDGSSMSIRNYKGNRDVSDPSVDAITDYYGRWNTAKEAAGLPTVTQRGEVGPPPNTRTKAQAKAALQTVAERVDGVLTEKQYRDRRDPDHPSATTIQREFEGWNNAKVAAGLETNEPAHQQPRDDHLDALREVADRVDGILSFEKYENNRDQTHPASSTIQQNLGWNEAKEEAGLEISHRGSDTRDSRERAVESLQRAADVYDGVPTTEQYRALGYSPSVSTIYRLFEDWNDALDEAGLTE